MVVVLASSLGGLSLNTRWSVMQDHRGFRLVPMLPARSATSFMPDFTISKQKLRG
jgi:hypothetical protein